MTTGPGVIIPIATASRNSRSDSQPKSCTTPCWRNGTIASPDPKVKAPALKKKTPSATSVAGSAEPAAATTGGPDPRPVPRRIQGNADEPREDEQDRDLAARHERRGRDDREDRPEPPVRL